MMKYRIGMIVAVFAFIAILPLKVEAAGAELKVAYEDTADGNKTAASVAVKLPNAAQEKISTLSLNLKLEPAAAEKVIPAIEFSTSLENAKVKEYRYNGTSLNIYVAGTEPLFTAGSDGDIMEIGTITAVKEASGEKAGFAINVGESELHVVRGGAEVTLSLTEAAGTPAEPAVPEPPVDPVTPEPDDPAVEEPSEIKTVREKLKDMIEKAESIPQSERSADLQSAIDKAKSVLENPEASLEELKAALMDLENAFALYESKKDSGTNSTDSGKEKQKENQKKNGRVTQAVKTGDENPAAIYIVVTMLSAVILGVNTFYRRRIQR